MGSGAGCSAASPAGGIILGLLIAAYAIGYHRGAALRPTASERQHSIRRRRTTTTSATTAAPPTSPRPGPVTATPALDRPRQDALHERQLLRPATPSPAPPVPAPASKASPAAPQHSTTDAEVTADDAYLERSIADPDAQIVKGYTAGLMAPAIASFDLAQKPDDIRALVAFIKSQK